MGCTLVTYIGSLFLLSLPPPIVIPKDSFGSFFIATVFSWVTYPWGKSYRGMTVQYTDSLMQLTWEAQIQNNDRTSCLFNPEHFSNVARWQRQLLLYLLWVETLLCISKVLPAGLRRHCLGNEAAPSSPTSVCCKEVLDKGWPLKATCIKPSAPRWLLLDWDQ